MINEMKTDKVNIMEAYKQKWRTTYKKQQRIKNLQKQFLWELSWEENKRSDSTRLTKFTRLTSTSNVGALIVKRHFWGDLQDPHPAEDARGQDSSYQ